jgi:molybdopterin-guanine dinucleotide biosynthesis protein A
VARRGLTGILLAGGDSRRFGSPKAEAPFEGETLGERAWRLLGEACDERLLVGPGGIDDPHTGPVAAIGAGLREATHDVAVVIPVDMPRLTVASLHTLADACQDAAMAQHGPLPCAIRRSAWRDTAEPRLRTVLERLDVARIELDEALLLNVNEPGDLR